MFVAACQIQHSSIVPNAILLNSRAGKVGLVPGIVGRSALMSGRQQQLFLQCDQCGAPCDHAGAAVDFLLQEKSLLGLAAPPDESVPLELLTREELLQRALGMEARIDRQPLQPGDVPAPFANIEKARRLLAYNPTTSMERGLAAFADWFRERRGHRVP